MSTDWVRACRGAVSSVVSPSVANQPSRLRSRIDRLARTRGVPSWYDRFEPDRIRTAAGDLHVDVVKGSSTGRTLVFMPGTNAYTLLYGEFLVAMAERGWTIVAFDPRGHGRSHGARGSYTIAELLDDYAAAVSYARTRFSGPLVVAGSSQGGITAFYYALSDDSVDAAVCHNLADLSDPGSVELTRFGSRGHSLRPWIERFARHFPEAPVPMQAYLDLRREPIRGQPHALHVLLEDPLIPWFVRAKTLASLGSAVPPRPIETLSVPTLVLQAGDDTIFPTRYIEGLVDRIPKAEVEIFPGLPHYMIVDHVDIVVPVAAAWLERSLGATRESNRSQ
ncbi:MAG: alpha/beta fold hydrolase [Polyangiales bacterium]